MSPHRDGIYLPAWVIPLILAYQLCTYAIAVLGGIEMVHMASVIDLSDEVLICLIAGAVLATVIYNVFNLLASYHEGKTKADELQLEALEDGRELTDLEKAKISNWGRFDVIFVGEGLVNVIVSAVLSVVVLAYIGIDYLGIEDSEIAVFGAAFIVGLVLSWLVDMTVTSAPATATWETKKAKAYSAFLSNGKEYARKLAEESGMTPYLRLVEKFKSAGVDEARASAMAEKALIANPELADE